MAEMKRIPCQELVSLYLASLFLVISASGSPQMGGGEPQMAGAPSAQMDGASSPQMGWGPSAQSGHSSPQMGETKGHFIGSPGGDNPEDAPMNADGMGKGSEDVVVQNWQGVAAKGNESLSVKLNVQTIGILDPGDARRLLASNISLEQVKSQTRSGYKDKILRGSLRLNNDTYRLVDIKFESSGNISTLEAGLASPKSTLGSEEIVGSALMTLSAVDDIEVAEGYVVINDSNYSNNYSIFMEKSYGRGPRAGR